MPIVNRLPFDSDNNDEHYEALVNRQTKNDKSNDTFRDHATFSIGSTIVVQYEDGRL